MNKQKADVLLSLLEEPFTTQRALSERCGHSLGVVNQSVKRLVADGYLTDDMTPTEKAREACEPSSPENAVILAAGFGMRMAPINGTGPKALLEVRGEPLIERLIRQLHEAGVHDITVVVGYMKEGFDYLVDEYGVRLAFNPDYAGKNNLTSLALVASRISNTYVLPCDIWCAESPFSPRELYSWYMVSDAADAESGVRVNRRGELVRTGGEKAAGNHMVGISYLTGDVATAVRDLLPTLAADPRHDDDFWEEALWNRDRMGTLAKVVRDGAVAEIDTFEQLRDLDENSGQLRSDALDTIAGVFGITPADVTGIEVLKKGMTNRSFLFTAKGDRYIMRIPGEGTDQLIDRSCEAAVYAAISGRGLCDDPVYMNPKTGYKITRFLEGVRTCDPTDETDLERCMRLLRSFHEMGLEVPHEFDIFGQIDFYEGLWEGRPSAFRDYAATKEGVLSLRPYIDAQPKARCLTHIDAVPDNFLFHAGAAGGGAAGGEALQLTDWEYAGMQDPHVDIAMFCIYSLYDKPQVDHLIDVYFQGSCDRATRTKIYCYVAACGLLWSNWCEYKRGLGVEFGEYSLRQYRYAKDFCRLAREEMVA